MRHHRDYPFNKPDVHIDISAVHGKSKVEINEKVFSKLITDAVDAALQLRSSPNSCCGCNRNETAVAVLVEISAVHDNSQVIIGK
ncbi:MAG: hypothetical protein EOO18_02735 [Chryseobacterium sp.]|nr:MAG: hypothetical protein EOO18_02735 [Chryseobacterium sp.]